MNSKKFLIAFDADDTLWVNEAFYNEAEQKLESLVGPYLKTSLLKEQLYEMETRNLSIFGYGVKGFILSMIETAIEITSEQIKGSEIQQIIDVGKDMLTQPIKLLLEVQETILHLENEYDLMIITKGDLFDQESKIARSGIADHFRFIEIVSEKNEEVYLNILKKNEIDSNRFMMVGNSLKSDILPVVNIGAHAVHIPADTTWQHEQISDFEKAKMQYHELTSMGQLPALLDQVFRNNQNREK
ncbi:MAG: HAD family hydrolase [SAR324 cluster bacterium]|nr:HAD family hydrolase [SAR324 cluster bacterium]